MKTWTADQIPDQSGRSFLVTGANSGLGFITARELARRNACVIMTARDEGKGLQALEQIRAAVPGAKIELRLLDLADLDQVRNFAGALIAEKTSIDVLVNNAGIMMPPRSLTRQGFELQFGVNHLAHFVLTGLLLGQLKAGHAPRVVTVSSSLHKRGAIHFNDLDGAKAYSRIAFYAQSKFANVLFALELDRRLRRAGLPIRSVLAHPGYAATNLQLNGTTGLLRLLMRFGNRFFAQSAEKGALNLLYATAAPDVHGGQFVGPDGRHEKSGDPTIVQPVASAKDQALAERLWRLSENLTGIRIDFSSQSEVVT